MRIIAGEFRGRKLHPIRGMNIRPTSDRLRETIFNILSDRVRDAVVLDLFAGTGALGIEALSRGAASAVFIDQAAGAIEAIRKNIAALGLEDRTRIIRWDAAGNLRCIREASPPFTLVFMDPPYGKGMIAPALEHLAGTDALASDACVMAEHTPEEPVPEAVASLRRYDRRDYGKTVCSYFQCE